MEIPITTSSPAQFDFFYAKRKIFSVILRGLIFIALFAALVLASISDWQREAPLSRIPSAEIWFLLFFFASLLSWFILRPLSQLAKLSTPILTMSENGIALRGRPPIPWHTIKRSYFTSFGYGGITVFSVIRIKTSSAVLPKTILADTLGISLAEYEKQSRIYGKTA